VLFAKWTSKKHMIMLIEFLQYMLRRCWYVGKWCSWIDHCVFSVRFSVLVNVAPTFFLVAPALETMRLSVSFIVYHCVGGVG
jgi:hypothetical protein